MYPPRIAPRRIPLLYRPLRPPRKTSSHGLRPFTQNTQLLLVAPPAPRPQLPFLSVTSRGPLNHGGQWQRSRWLTTENKRYLRQQFWLAGKYTVFGWLGFFLLSMIGYGVATERLEHKYPTPAEWSFWSRNAYRDAKELEEEEESLTGVVDWVKTSGSYRSLVARLEDPKIDGKGLVEQEEGGIFVPGVGKAGFSIEAKSEPWRRGYFDALMGAARAAERLDGWVVDNTTKICFPADVVIGPSNPQPRPVPYGAPAAPLEENCSPATDPPETYYLRILTTKGFGNRQRLAAALAYADWLDYKDLPSAAEEMYRWGLDIASSPFPDPSSIVDLETGVIRSDAPAISTNLLLASTSLAIHYAHQSNVSAALPIFLSALRARRALPPAPPGSLRPKTDESKKDAMALLTTIYSYITPPTFPPPPPSGDEPPLRSAGELCEEAGLMSYIGEVLFASSSQIDGLGWTRQAVDLAESVFNDKSMETEGKERCRECLEVGMSNWKKMVARRVKEEQEKEDRVKDSWWRKIGLGGSTDEVARWENEKTQVEERAGRVTQLLFEDRSKKYQNSGMMIFNL